MPTPPTPVCGPHPPPCSDGTAKLGDLGMARLMSANYVTGVVGTLAW